MAQARTDALVDSWKTKANLQLSADQEQKVKAWLGGAAERLRARRQAGREVLTQLQAAVQGGDNAKTEELLQKLREGLRQLSDAREKALDEFDKLLQPEQRARLVLQAAQHAKESGRTVESLVDSLLSQGNDDN